MTIRGVIFDVDGTLVDTNSSHVEAWRRAFQKLGFDVSRDQIVPEIGKGGDKLVPALLGPQVEADRGDELRKVQKQEFLEIAQRTRFRVFPGAVQVFEALRSRGIRTALATSSNQKHFDATSKSAGVDLGALPDVVVTRGAEEPSKPSPDLVTDAVAELGLPASNCAMVGDTVYDGEACQAAGVIFLGVLSGPASKEQLLEAGACGVWRDVGHLLEELDRALEVASLTAAAAD